MKLLLRPNLDLTDTRAEAIDHPVMEEASATRIEATDVASTTRVTNPHMMMTASAMPTATATVMTTASHMA